MSKKFARRNLICFAVLAVLLIVLCFVNIAVPATTSRFVGFVPAITEDIDIGGGVASKYEVNYDSSVTDQQAELKKTVSLLNNTLSNFGYGTARVSAGTNNNIYVEIPAIRQSSEILDAIGVQGALYITTNEVDDIDETTAITGDDVVDVTSQFSQVSTSSFCWGVNINLTDSGKDKLADMTEDASSSSAVTLNIFVGEETISQISISSQVTSSALYFYGTSSTMDQANVTVMQILMGKQHTNFDMVNNEIIQVDPSISSNIQMWIYIALAIISIALIAFFFVCFGELGYIVLLNYVFFLGLTAFFMQAIPIYALSFGGIVGLTVGIILFFMSNFIAYNSAKRGYAEGKKIPLAIKMGINNNVMKIVDISVALIICAVAFYIIGGVFMQSFALTIGICAALNLLTSLAMNKLFTKWYTRINTRDPKKLHFKREEHVNELN